MASPPPQPDDRPARPSTTPNVSLNRPLGSIRPQVSQNGVPMRGIGNTTAGITTPGLGPSITRTGAPRMTFLPNHPVRRKIATDADAHHAATSDAIPPGGAPTRGTGPGRGRGRGGPPSVGRGRGEVSMVASGPFALGPAAAGSSTSFRRPNNSFSSVGLGGPTAIASSESGLSNSTAPALRMGLPVGGDDTDGEGNMSEDDAGVIKVDMDHVAVLDWNAPVALKNRKEGKVRDYGAHSAEVKGAQHQVIKSEQAIESMSSMDGQPSESKDDINALDLSESDEDEELEDVVEYFTRKNLETAHETTLNAENLYFFQFPLPFPTFTSNIDLAKDSLPQGQEPALKTGDDSKTKAKTVSWAPDVKLEGESNADLNRTQGSVDGVIGRLEVYKSGAVKMRFGSNVVMDITVAAQPGFLQQVVHVDLERNRMSVLGDITRRFTAVPDVDTLLAELTGDAPASKADATLDGLEVVEMEVEVD